MGSIKVGDRIGVGIDRGVVCYVGPVDGYKGDWIGVDWDDPKRGKHDGTVNGRSYFHATGKTSGSFVRASKVDTGKTITEEMESRYAKDSKMDQHEIGAKTIELVNMEKTYTKQKNLWKLSCVVLDNKNVAKPPLADCPPFESCKELNLYNNLIAKWSDLFAILDFFPSLLYLNVRRNIMEPRMSSVDRKVKSTVILLVISECHIDEETAKKLMQIFPRLAELYISRNGLKYFDPGDYGRNLTVLDLEGNPINDFTRLHNLASLPRLVSLNLTECGLTAIRLPDPVGFYALKTLIMRNNDVHDWESVSEIAKLPALQQLLYNGNWQVKPEFGLDVREVLIAKLPKLIDLERSEISPVERRSAEIRFLNKYSVSPVCQQHVNDIERNTLGSKKFDNLHSEYTDLSNITEGGL
ncbi:Tubulin-specific chaperone E [Toxocara canis]|uniref:Tubulin-specific chaperone E n=1 Tax=Toxocara canis TaxID=6265 RepID=A0A0B2UU80_TOXCA|nr:Tubulin-specific chaperone E [Toxocara canis]